jgi:hypothetical protein
LHCPHSITESLCHTKRDDVSIAGNNAVAVAECHTLAVYLAHPDTQPVANGYTDTKPDAYDDVVTFADPQPDPVSNPDCHHRANPYRYV